MATPAATQRPQTKVLSTLKIGATGKDGVKDGKALASVLGRPLGSPINGKNEGDQFNVTLTGNIEIREFNGQKGAYYTTNEGYSIRVNASFDPAIHKAGAVLPAICRVLPIDGRDVKFCAFVD